MKVLEPILVALLVALAFPPFGIWPLALVGFVFFMRPLLEGMSPRAAARHVAIYSYAVNIFGFYWLAYTLAEFGGMPWLVSIPLTMIIFAFFAIIPWWAGWLWGRYSPRVSERAHPWALAIFFILFDGLDLKFFPWTPAMSVGQVPILLASVYKLGTWGWRILFFGLAVALAHFINRERGNRLLSKCAGATALVLAIGLVAGTFARSELKTRYSGRQPVALIQGNVGNYEKKLTKLKFMPTVRNVLMIHRDLIERTAAHFAESSQAGIEPWILWPETSYPGMASEGPDQRLLLNWTQLTRGLHIVGAYEAAQSDFAGGKAVLDYNILALFHERDGFVSRYRKVIRIPFGEFIPGDEYYPDAYKLLPAVNHFGAGVDKTGLAHPDPKGPVFIPAVCYELLFESFMNDFVAKARAKYPGRELVLVNPSNDSWYGPTSEPFQNALLARWAAVRLGLPLLRPTNTGLSIAAAPWGEVTGSGPRDESTVIFGELPVERVQHRLVDDNGKAPPL